MRRVLVASLTTLGLLGTANGVTAQGGDTPRSPRVELWGAVSGVLTGPAGALVTSYSPPLLFDGDFTSRGGQTLKADSSVSVGWTGGVNVFPTRRVGFQIVADRTSYDVSATNTSYAVALEYVSRQPPSNDAQTVNVNRSIAWPHTTGALTQVAVAFNAAVQVGRPDGIAVIISGGPTYYRLGGTVQPLGFTTFRLGGHSVLFQDDYRLALSLEPANALGFDTGGEFSMAAGRHAAIIAGYRYFGGPHAEVVVSPATILNAGELPLQLSIADVATRLALPPMRISVSSSRVFVGVRVTP